MRMAAPDIPDSRPGATIADDLAARVGEAIMAGEFEAGTWLRQATLAQRYGVSRQPVREALRQLQAYGMVEIHPSRGALVRRPSPSEMREAYLVRAELEGLAAELASQRITLDGLHRLHEAQRAFTEAAEASGDDPRSTTVLRERAATNDAFHEAIVDAAGAPILARSLESLHRVVPRSVSTYAQHTRRLLTENITQHDDIVAAIEAGDSETARAAMRRHVLGSGELIAHWFEREQREREQARRALQSVPEA
jgi:DNA-binding GntR family transcriptional regulator